MVLSICVNLTLWRWGGQSLNPWREEGMSEIIPQAKSLGLWLTNVDFGPAIFIFQLCKQVCGVGKVTEILWALVLTQRHRVCMLSWTEGFVCVCLASAEPQLLKEKKGESGKKANTCNLSTWGVEARLGLQSQPQLHSEVKASWYYMRFYTTMTQKSRQGGTNNQDTYFRPISVIAIFSQPPIPLWGFRCIPWPSSFVFR